jgi:hypothetical protein
MTEMWKREEFLIANGMSQLPNSSMTNDLSPYDYFDGGLDVSVDREFSDATGSGRRARRRVKNSRTSRRDKTRPKRAVKSNSRNPRKTTQAKKQAQKIANVQKSAEADATLLAQLTQTPAPVVTAPTGMTKGTKTALIIGGVAVLGVVGFMMYKKFKK